MPPSPSAQSPFDRLAAFRVIYAGIFAYVVLAVAAFQGAETLLTRHFREAVETATRVSPADGPVIPQIQARVEGVLRGSAWTAIGGVRVDALVLGADGRTPIYLGGRTLPPPQRSDLERNYLEAGRLLPAIAAVQATLPLDSLLAGSIWVGLGTILIPILFFHNRAVAQREEALFNAALAARDATAERARSIQNELDKVQDRLARLEPAERAHNQEIATLEAQRSAMQGQLRELSERERRLRERAARESELDQERQALEDLLEEAVLDLEQKEGEIRQLQESLKRAARTQPEGRGRARAAEQLEKRLRTLYRNLEIDDRAIDDMLALGDESLRLRAEECLKKLDESPESAGIRRKVGGLPPQLAIFELGFAGKGRIYVSRGRQRSHRVLAIGGKASQKTDLEYLSRLSLD